MISFLPGSGMSGSTTSGLKCIAATILITDNLLELNWKNATWTIDSIKIKDNLTYRTNVMENFSSGEPPLFILYISRSPAKKILNALAYRDNWLAQPG